MIDTLTSPLLAKYPFLVHFFSMRTGGHSKPPFQWANMSIKSGDPDALRNRQILAEQLDVSLDKFIFMDQAHSDNIHIAYPQDAGKGSTDFNTAIKYHDALVTASPDLMLTVTTADCVPILLADTRQKVIAAVHAGWRGSAKLITFKAVQKMKDGYNSQAKDIIAAIGPAIGPCCYNVGEDVFEAFKYTLARKANDFFTTKNGKLYLDLWENNHYQLLQAGIPESNIDTLAICTSCNNDKFFSARRGDKGRQIAGIMLKASDNG